MIIESLTITPNELAEAVHQWLESKYKIGCKVLEVSKKYTHYQDYTVKLNTEIENPSVIEDNKDEITDEATE